MKTITFHRQGFKPIQAAKPPQGGVALRVWRVNSDGCSRWYTDHALPSVDAAAAFEMLAWTDARVVAVDRHLDLCVETEDGLIDFVRFDRFVAAAAPILIPERENREPVEPEVAASAGRAPPVTVLARRLCSIPTASSSDADASHPSSPEKETTHVRSELDGAQ